VAARQPHQLGCLFGRNAASGQIPEHVHPVDLSAAHRNHRHQTRAPQHRHDMARRVTSETGRMVTFVSVIYTMYVRIVDYDAKRNGFRQSGFARLFQALC
jgi:hypothetical protein